MIKLYVLQFMHSVSTRTCEQRFVLVARPVTIAIQHSTKNITGTNDRGGTGDMTKSSLGVFVTERHGAPRLLVVRSTVVLLLVLCSKVVLLIHGAVIWSVGVEATINKMSETHIRIKANNCSTSCSCLRLVVCREAARLGFVENANWSIIMSTQQPTK